jgi:hypothetical protein
VNGIDYFDRNNSEVIGYTPCCIARVHRSKAHKHRLVVSADGSYDVNKAKLTYTWVVLRGDPDTIKIVPKKDDQSVAEITIAWHDRRPVSAKSPLESNRVDIGVFVHNGTYYSAPGFVTVCTLDCEARIYNKDGKLLSIAHSMGETEMRVKDWDKLLANLSRPFFTLTEGEQANLRGVIAVRASRKSFLETEKELLTVAEGAWKSAKEKDVGERAFRLVEELRKNVADRQKKLDSILDEKALGDTPRRYVESRLAVLTRDPLFTQKHQDWLAKSQAPGVEARIKPLWKKLHRLGIANDRDVLTPLLPGKSLANANWTAFERAYLEWLHASLLAELALPGTEVIWRTNYVDHRLSAPREWRDVYRYDPKGEYIGWMRYSADGIQVFNHEGLLAVDRDALGRVNRGRTVRYIQDPPKAKQINLAPLRMVPGDTIVRYEFAGGDDWRGKRVGTEPAKDEKK